MGISVETLAVSKKYTDDSLVGVGALAGKPCQIQSIAPITGGNRVTFLWVDDNSDTHTSTMDVMNGAQGETGQTGPAGADGADGKDGKDGVGIKSLAINSSNHLIVTLTNDNTVDAGEIPAVQSDWTQSDSSASDFIKNKPTLGTAASKDSTDEVSQDNRGLVESQAVHCAIATALADYTTTVNLTTLLADKADKVSSATNGNFAGLDASGNLTDSGKKASDFASAGGLTDEIKKRFVNNCKNVLPIRLKSQTARGVTFTRNENDSFSLSGTCTGNPLTVDLFSASVYTNTGDSSAFKIEKGIVIDKTKPYILTRGDTQIRFTLALYQDGVSVATVGFDSTGGNPFMEIDFSSYTFNEIKAVVRFGNNTSYSNKTFIPMLCLKSDYQVDSGQQYYTKTNKQLTDEIVGWDNFSELGAVNYIYPNEGSSTKSGVLYTLNDDNSCTLSGTAEGGGGFQWLSYNGENLVGKEITFNAGNDAIYSDMYFAFICRATLGGENLLRHDVYLGKLNRTDTITVPAGTKVILCGFNIPASYTGAVSMTLKPILTLPSYNGPYVPYAKTNRELTEDVTSLNAMYDGKAPSAVSDLNVPLTAGGATVAFTRHFNNTTNAPTNGGGLEITWSSSDKYGAQLTLTDGGLYFRTNNSGTISAWQKIST